jgi:hypothetical protein
MPDISLAKTVELRIPTGEPPNRNPVNRVKRLKSATAEQRDDAPNFMKFV